MKGKYISLILVLFTSGIAITCPLYKILNTQGLNVSKLTNSKVHLKNEFKGIINKLYDSDQKVRKKGDAYFRKYAVSIDSNNYLLYKKFITHNGYYSVSYENFYQYPIDTVTKLIMENYALQIHFSDLYGMDLIELIQNSIRKGSCNEEDLIQYYTTYIWRKTEFDKGMPHFVPLPILYDSAFTDSALFQYLRYCAKLDSTFQYTILSNIFVSRANKFDWSNVFIKSSNIKHKNRNVQSNYYFNILKPIIEYIISHDNPTYEFNNKNIALLMCTHPNSLVSPTFPLK